MQNLNTAVLVHGCHLLAQINGKSWQDIVLGSGTEHVTLEGRGVMGLSAAHTFNAEYLILGTGASEIGGVGEAVYTKNVLENNFVSICRELNLSENERVRLYSILSTAVINTDSKNTKDEISHALNFCITHNVGMLILVSSTWHMPRCLKYASDLTEKIRECDGTAPIILALPSHGDTYDVSVSEPPHRGDRPKFPIHQLVRRADSLGRNNTVAGDFCPSLEHFLEDWERILNSQ